MESTPRSAMEVTARAGVPSVCHFQAMKERPPALWFHPMQLLHLHHPAIAATTSSTLANNATADQATAVVPTHAATALHASSWLVPSVRHSTLAARRLAQSSHTAQHARIISVTRERAGVIIAPIGSTRAMASLLILPCSHIQCMEVR